MTDEAWQRTAITNQFRHRVSLKAAGTPSKHLILHACQRRCVVLTPCARQGELGSQLGGWAQTHPMGWQSCSPRSVGLEDPSVGLGDPSVRAGRDPLHSEHSHAARTDVQTLTKPRRMALLQPRGGTSKKTKHKFSVSNLIEPAVHSSTELGRNARTPACSTSFQCDLCISVLLRFVTRALCALGGPRRSLFAPFSLSSLFTALQAPAAHHRHILLQYLQ